MQLHINHTYLFVPEGRAALEAFCATINDLTALRGPALERGGLHDLVMEPDLVRGALTFRVRVDTFPYPSLTACIDSAHALLQLLGMTFFSGTDLAALTVKVVTEFRDDRNEVVATNHRALKVLAAVAPPAPQPPAAP
jgi:hypothetical protein